ncbi:recombinase family protein [Hyphobacterium sp.]|uniref:recombinase family protein n=1 Tax=Hyphobacterium sp. TaxID=2004662 RepID=UPI0037496CF9
MKEQAGRPVGVWIRVSTEDQAKGDSPGIHRARAEQYAAFKGWEIVEYYDLSGVSGKGIINQPEALRMLEDVKSGRISALLFSKLARLARNTKELLEFSDIFSKHNADLVSLHESIDTSTPAGRLFYTMIAAIAEWEREEIVDRVKAAALTRAKLGKRVAGSAPFGYHWQDGKFVPHPDEAPVRKLIYELFAEYHRKNAVARELNDRGYRTRRGKKFAINSIQLLLRDPTAKGIRRTNYSHNVDGSVELKPESEWIWQTCEPIVSVELWDQCNAILDKQSKGRAPGPRGKYLFAGKIKCAHDHHTMYVLNETPKFVCRKCRNKIPQDDIEAIFRDQLRNFFASDVELKNHMGETQKELSDKKEQVEVLKREKVGLVQDREQLLRGYLDKTLKPARFRELDTRAGERLEQIDTSIGGLEGQIAALEVADASSDEIISEARDLYGRWDKLTFDQKRRIIESITDEIIVGDRDIQIHLHYVPDSLDSGESMQKTFSLLPSGSRK